MAKFSGLVSVEMLVVRELTLITAAALGLFYPPAASIGIRFTRGRKGCIAAGPVATATPRPRMTQ